MKRLHGYTRRKPLGL